MKTLAKMLMTAALPGFALAMMMLTGPRASAQDEAAVRVDTVLDRLEKRLLDQESDGLTFDEKNQTPFGKSSADSDGAPTHIEVTKKTKIESSTKERDSIKELGLAIAELDQQVDQFASGVQKTKQSILDEAHIDNFITVDAKMADTEVAAITALTVRVDGFVVYELKESSGLWMPSNLVPLYAGPLKPGNHRLDLEARIVMKPKKALPMNGDVYRFVNKSFDVTIPGGARAAKYLISILPPEKLDGTADAVIKEAT